MAFPGQGGFPEQGTNSEEASVLERETCVVHGFCAQVLLTHSFSFRSRECLCRPHAEQIRQANANKARKTPLSSFSQVTRENEQHRNNELLPGLFSVFVEITKKKPEFRNAAAVRVALRRMNTRDIITAVGRA